VPRARRCASLRSRRCEHGASARRASRTYPDEAPAKFHVIANGYDQADFEALPERASGSGNCLCIVHAGSINAEFRDPAPVFASLGRLISAGVVSTDECELRFIGPGEYGASRAVKASIDSAGLDNVVRLLPRVPYDQALKELTQADLLLLLQASEDTLGSCLPSFTNICA
jgi:hypothetical protein